MTSETLADQARVAETTLSDFEKGKRLPHPHTIAAIRAALEIAGVEFIEDKGEGAGVRLKKPPSDAIISLEDLNAENDN